MKRTKAYSKHDRSIVLWTIAGAIALLVAIWKSPRIHADDPGVIVMGCFLTTILVWGIYLAVNQRIKK